MLQVMAYRRSVELETSHWFPPTSDVRTASGRSGTFGRTNHYYSERFIANNRTINELIPKILAIGCCRCLLFGDRMLLFVHT